MADKCEDCKWCHSEAKNIFGASGQTTTINQCRKNPPASGAGADDKWPTVAADDWCGSFEAKPA